MEIFSGYSFRPSDEQLCTSYLRDKLEGKPLPSQYMISGLLNVYDVNRCPWEIFDDNNPHWIITSDSSSFDDDKNIVKKIKKTIYAFTELKKNGPGWMRSSGGGTWKGQNKKYLFNMQGEVIGFKRSLTFYRGNKKNKDDEDGSEGNWTMHEYWLPHHESFVLCKITKRLEFTITAEISHDVAAGQGDDYLINHMQHDLVPLDSLPPNSNIVEDTIVNVSEDKLFGDGRPLLSLLLDDEEVNVKVQEMDEQGNVGKENKIYLDEIDKFLNQENPKELGGDGLENNLSDYLTTAATAELHGLDNLIQEYQKELVGDVHDMEYNSSDYLSMTTTTELQGDNYNVDQINTLEVPEEATPDAPMSSNPNEDVRISDYVSNEVPLVEELPAWNNNQQLDVAAGLSVNYNVDINQGCKFFSNFKPEQVVYAVAEVMKSYNEDVLLDSCNFWTNNDEFALGQKLLSRKVGDQQKKMMMEFNAEEENQGKNLKRKRSNV